jgi:hypothetical protein
MSGAGFSRFRAKNFSIIALSDSVGVYDVAGPFGVEVGFDVFAIT